MTKFLPYVAPTWTMCLSTKFNQSDQQLGGALPAAELVYWCKLAWQLIASNVVCCLLFTTSHNNQLPSCIDWFNVGTAVTLCFVSLSLDLFLHQFLSLTLFQSQLPSYFPLSCHVSLLSTYTILYSLCSRLFCHDSVTLADVCSACVYVCVCVLYVTLTATHDWSQTWVLTDDSRLNVTKSKRPQTQLWLKPWLVISFFWLEIVSIVQSVKKKKIECHFVVPCGFFS